MIITIIVSTEWQLTHSTSIPSFSATPHMAEEQTKGVAMVPKRALNVMSGEVVRLLQLTKYTIVPVSYIVPRKVSQISV